MHNQTTEHNLMLEFERAIAELKSNPDVWYEYSGKAYEVIYSLETSGDKYTEHMRQTLDSAIESIGIKLGCIGQDHYDRNIIVDYYGTSYETTLPSIAYACRKQAQYRRIRAKLSKRYQNTQNELDKLNKRIYRYTYDTSKNYLDRIARREQLAYNALSRIKVDLQVEFYRLSHSIPETRQ